MKVYNVLSLGAGVQSSALAMLSVEGIIPRYDAVVFADTGWESQQTYDSLDWLKEKLESVGTDVYYTKFQDVRKFADQQFKGRKPSIPLYTKHKETGKKGMLRRGCTVELKIWPVEKVVREKIIGVKPRKWVKDAFVNLSLGISTDEMQRVNKSRHKWCKHIFPLIELKWDRQKCEEWLISNYDFEPGRSACLGCPYHSNEFFRNLSKEEFEQVVEFDEKIRNLSSDNYEWFVSRERIPIKDLDLNKDNGPSFLEECSGLCGN